MELMEAIRTRRSIRKFEDRPVPEEMIRDILDAAMMAPSAGNAQPWQFVIVTDRSVLDSMQDMHPHIRMVTQARLGILICGDLGLEKFKGYWVQDCSAAMQNMLLAIHAKGLGAVWTGVYPMEERVALFKEKFDLPKHVIPLGFVPIGWPAQGPKTESRYREDRVHMNKW